MTTTTFALVLLAACLVGWSVTARLATTWWHRLHTDPLTGLPNRAALARAFVRARRCSFAVAVVLIDLDCFKAINDLWGHHAGNIMLRHVAAQLTVTCGVYGSATPVRLHGDEFAILLTDLPPGPSGAELAEAYARRLAVAIGVPVPYGTDRLAVTGSAGVAVAPAAHADLSALLRVADQRMYATKTTTHGGAELDRGWSA